MVEFLTEELLEALDEILKAGDPEEIQKIEVFIQERFNEDGTLSFNLEDLEDD